MTVLAQAALPIGVLLPPVLGVAGPCAAPASRSRRFIAYGSLSHTGRVAQVPPTSAIPLPASDDVSRGEPAGRAQNVSRAAIHAVPLDREE